MFLFEGVWKREGGICCIFFNLEAPHPKFSSENGSSPLLEKGNRCPRVFNAREMAVPLPVWGLESNRGTQVNCVLQGSERDFEVPLG